MLTLVGAAAAGLRVGEATTIHSNSQLVIGAKSVEELRRALTIQSQDAVAFRKLQDGDTIKVVPDRERVFVVSCPAGDVAEIRIQGEVDTLWVLKDSLLDYEWQLPPRLNPQYADFQVFSDGLATFCRKIEAGTYSDRDFADELLPLMRTLKKPTTNDAGMKEVVTKLGDVLQSSADVYALAKLRANDSKVDQETVAESERDFLRASEAFLNTLRRLNSVTTTGPTTSTNYCSLKKQCNLNPLR